MFASPWLRPIQRRFFPRRVTRRALLRQADLRLKVLEDRTVPTMFNVGAGEVPTLIADIHAANPAGVRNTLTGPAAPERSVCAPGPRSFPCTSEYRSQRGDFL